jgi:hypothetical protein
VKKPLSTRRALTGAALAAVAGAALALPSTGLAGAAAIQDDVLTTAQPGAQIDQRLDMVRKTKAKIARFDILWSFVAIRQPANPTDPNDPAYDWSRPDQVLLGLDAANITPIVSVYSTPQFAQATRATQYVSAYNPNAPTPKAFQDFMQAAAKRYSGTFTTATGQRLPRVRHWEIWNEPNLRGFFRYGNNSNLGKYKGIVKAGYTGIKAGNRNTIVIAGVGGPRSSGGGGNVGAKTWLNGLVSDKSVKFDAYSQHIYPSKGPKFESPSYDKVFPTWSDASLDTIFKALDKKKKGMKLYVTEAGYTTAATEFRNVKVTPAQQNTYLKQLYNLPKVKGARIAAVVWFNLQDNKNWPGGLLRSNGGKKPSYNSFVAVARRAIQGNLRSTLAN